MWSEIIWKSLLLINEDSTKVKTVITRKSKHIFILQIKHAIYYNTFRQGSVLQTEMNLIFFSVFYRRQDYCKFTF